MLRRSLLVLSKHGDKRTIVRDPRKRTLPATVRTTNDDEQQTEIQPHKTPLPFEPTTQNQQAVGSTLGSYVLMGAGVAVGFAIVGALFGG